MPEDPDEKRPELTKRESQLFSLIIKNFSMALKNSSLYPREHPILKASIDNFCYSFEKWFDASERFELGVAQDALYVGSAQAGAGDERAVEVANYLHVRGIISMVFLKGLNSDELGGLFNFIKEDKKIVREKGGVLANVPPSPHIHIKEIDYSTLLKKQKDIVVRIDEGKIWQLLFDIGKDISSGGELPESKVEFLMEFFEDTHKSATVINKVYKDAVNLMEGEETAKNIRGTVARLCEYFEVHFPDKGKDMKADLMKIISQLNPDLINTLFEKTVVDDRDLDLAEEVTKDLSDGFIAEFIESLIAREDNFNENLLKVFDRLAPGEVKANSVAGMVADSLLGKKALDADALTKLQVSIKEIFKTHPRSNFMSQMYGITVDAVMNKKIDTLVYVARLSPLLDKFARSMEEEKLRKEEVWLLLNVLWLESNPLECNKVSSKLAGPLAELIEAKDTGRIREIVEFFTEKMRPEQLADPYMSVEINDAVARILSKEAIDSMISFVDEADPKCLDDIGVILSRAGARGAGPLIDAFLSEKNPAMMNKYRQVFAKNSQVVIDEVAARLERVDAAEVRGLLSILREYDNDRANRIAKGFFRHKDARVRWEGIGAFEPRTEEDRQSLFSVVKKEKDKEVRKKAATALLETGIPAWVELLFEHAQRGLFNRAFLVDLVEACGQVKCREAFSYLAKLFVKKSLFNTASRDDLRVAVATSLGRLRTPEAIALIASGSNDKSVKVREFCEILIKLDRSGREEQSGQGSKGNANVDK